MGLLEKIDVFLFFLSLSFVPLLNFDEERSNAKK